MSFDDGNQPVQIALVNEATADPGVTMTALAAALTTQVHRDFSPAWGLPPVIVAPQKFVPAGWWGLVLLDDADQAGALGYHDLTPDDLPVGKVFVRTTLDDGQVVSVTASHELLEMLIDPGIQMCAQSQDGTSFYAYEVCDAVEDVSYAINGVEVSDFVFPAWFEGFRKKGGVKFSFRGSVGEPFALTKGGYISVYRDGSWGQTFGSEAARARFNPARKRRAVRRSASHSHAR